MDSRLQLTFEKPGQKHVIDDGEVSNTDRLTKSKIIFGNPSLATK
jgi:hypothetical protein